MNGAPALIGYAATVGFLVPRLLLRSDWSQRSPVLGVVAWQALTVSFVVATALATHHLAAPTEHLHVELVGILHFCGLALGAGAPPEPGTEGALAIALPVIVMAVPFGSFVAKVLRGRCSRTRHLNVLDIVGRPSSELGATVLAHHLPAVYCLPGRHPRIVVSEGALRLLSPEQLDAVLEHERAHIAGRHHLALAMSEAFAAVFRGLPLARHAREQTAMLLEMIADDRALRRRPREVLATALYEMAAARAPHGAFAVGGPTALLRLRRVLDPHRPPHPAVSASTVFAAAAAPLLPLLFGCVPAVG